MNKFLLIVLIVTTNISISQDYSFSKKVDNNLEISNPINVINVQIEYKKVLGDKILRRESNKIQLFNSEFEKEWELELDLLEGLGSNNYFTWNANENYIFVFQYSMTFKNDKVLSKLIRIDYEGNKKEIIFSDIKAVRGGTVIEIYDDKVYFLGTSTSGTVNPYMNTLIIYYHLYVFDIELNEVLYNHDLPHHHNDTDYNNYWFYRGSEQNTSHFSSIVSYDKKGKTTESISKVVKQELVHYKINTTTGSFETQYEELNPEEKIIPNKIAQIYTDYDKEKYQLYLNQHEFEGINFKRKSPLESITIKNGTSNSENLMEKFLEISGVTSKIKNLGELLLVNFVEDPINEGYTLLILRGYGTETESVLRYGIVISPDLKIERIYEYNVYYDSFVRPFENSMRVFTKPRKNSWGERSSGYKDNAYDWSIQNGGDSFISIFNYEDYQVLLEDNRKTKETKVYKFTR